MTYRLLTKDEAWLNPSPLTEQSIPIDKSVHEFKFTRNWFKNRNQCTFSTFFPLFFDGTKPVNLIQIGVFEGMDLVWQMQNTLRHPDSKAFAVDPWLATSKLDQQAMDEVHDRAIWNLRPYRSKVQVHRGLSQDVLSTAVKAGRLAGIKNGKWDIAIIDGDHRSEAVIKDATLALQMVRPGGWLLFDDTRTQTPKRDEVEVGLLKFLKTWGDGLSIVFSHRFCDCYSVNESPSGESSGLADTNSDIPSRMSDYLAYRERLIRQVKGGK